MSEGIDTRGSDPPASLALDEPKPLPDTRLSIANALDEAQMELGENATPHELLASAQKWLKSLAPQPALEDGLPPSQPVPAPAAQSQSSAAGGLVEVGEQSMSGREYLASMFSPSNSGRNASPPHLQA